MRVWPLNAAAHYRQSLTLNKHTADWLKVGGWLQYEETDVFFSSNKWFLETRMKQISSNRTKRGLSHFIWQLLSSVVAILNSPFIRFWGKGSIPSTNGCSPLPSKTRTEAQMSRQEGEWWKGGWGGGGGCQLCVRKRCCRYTVTPDRNVPGEAALAARGHISLPLIWSEEEQHAT